MTPRQIKSAQKKIDARIDAAYTATCDGIQIDIFDISKIFVVGRIAIEQGCTDETLRGAILAFVQTIRKN